MHALGPLTCTARLGMHIRGKKVVITRCNVETPRVVLVAGDAFVAGTALL